MGYVQARINQETSVYKLHCQSFKIEKVDTTGEKPGWISNHQAFYREPLNKIYISGGQVWREINEKTEYTVLLGSRYLGDLQSSFSGKLRVVTVLLLAVVILIMRSFLGKKLIGQSKSYNPPSTNSQQ